MRLQICNPNWQSFVEHTCRSLRIIVLFARMLWALSFTRQLSQRYTLTQSVPIYILISLYCSGFVKLGAKARNGTGRVHYRSVESLPSIEAGLYFDWDKCSCLSLFRLAGVKSILSSVLKGPLCQRFLLLTAMAIPETLHNHFRLGPLRAVCYFLFYFVHNNNCREQLDSS